LNFKHSVVDLPEQRRHKAFSISPSEPVVDYSGILNNNINSICTTVPTYQETCLSTSPITNEVPYFQKITNGNNQTMDCSSLSLSHIFDTSVDFGNDSLGFGLLDIPDFDCLQPSPSDFNNFPPIFTDQKSSTTAETQATDCSGLQLTDNIGFENLSPLNQNFETSLDIEQLLAECQNLINADIPEMPVLKVAEANEESLYIQEDSENQTNPVLNIITITPEQAAKLTNSKLEVSLVEENDKEFCIKIGRPTSFLTNTQTTIDLGQLDDDNASMITDDEDYFSDSKSYRRKPRQQNPKPIIKGSAEYLDKRKRNNIAVRKSRLKAKSKSKEHESIVKKLTQENVSLQNKVELLTKELNVIKGLFSHFGKSFSKTVEEKLNVIDLL